MVAVTGGVGVVDGVDVPVALGVALTGDGRVAVTDGDDVDVTVVGGVAVAEGGVALIVAVAPMVVVRVGLGGADDVGLAV
jgi:hypothetical protein